MRYFTLFSALVLSALTALPFGLPVRGLHCSSPGAADIPLAVRFIRDALPKEGVNVLVVEFNYRYQYRRRPEVVEEGALSREDLKQLAAACRQAGVKLIPQISCLGHQSWARQTFALLRAHPEFDETPGKYPDNEGIYCRSYCPLHPAVHAVLFDLMDELAEVCEADAFHVGMDEVFLLGEQDCERCRGKNKAELLAGEVTRLHDHLAKSNRTMWMWADRFIDGDVTQMGRWEASENHTAPAIRMVPKDIVMCDWHYERAHPSAAFFALEGFPVVSSPWRRSGVALRQLDQIRLIRENASDAVTGRAQGMLQTTWTSMGAFVRSYFGEEKTNIAAMEAAQCFKELFRAIRAMDR